jgi:hypothetical protein
MHASSNPGATITPSSSYVVETIVPNGVLKLGQRSMFSFGKAQIDTLTKIFNIT